MYSAYHSAELPENYVMQLLVINPRIIILRALTFQRYTVNNILLKIKCYLKGVPSFRPVSFRPVPFRPRTEGYIWDGMTAEFIFICI